MCICDVGSSLLHFCIFFAGVCKTETRTAREITALFVRQPPPPTATITPPTTALVLSCDHLSRRDQIQWDGDGTKKADKAGAGAAAAISDGKGAGVGGVGGKQTIDDAKLKSSEWRKEVNPVRRQTGRQATVPTPSSRLCCRLSNHLRDCSVHLFRLGRYTTQTVFVSL